jgi:hypothetical protein
MICLEVSVTGDDLRPLSTVDRRVGLLFEHVFA